MIRRKDVLAAGILIYAIFWTVWALFHTPTIPVTPSKAATSIGDELRRQQSNGDERPGQECRYEGHCPIHTTCVMKSDGDYGQCEPYLNSEGQPDATPSSLCIEPCLAELKWDERMYYHGTIDVISTHKTTVSEGRPNGCVIVYRRHMMTYKEGDLAIRQEWLDATSRHFIVRVDPVEPFPHKNTDGMLWQAMCFDPCTTNDDCTPVLQNQRERTAFACQDGACQRNRDPSTSYWIPPNQTWKDLVIVSGASSGFFRGLTNFVASVNYWEPRIRIVIYNLGFSKEQLQEISTKWKNVFAIKWPDGIPKDYPGHVHQLKKYAWKPILINESLHEYNMILWLDARSVIVGPLDPVERILEQTGTFLVKGQDTSFAQKSYPATYEYLGVNKSTFVTETSYHGGTQAHLLPSRYLDEVVIRGAECAMDDKCIAPPGSSLGNHRYDQTALSILAYKAGVPHHTEYLAANARTLSKDLDKPSFKRIWTAREGCVHYSQKGYHLKK